MKYSIKLTKEPKSRIKISIAFEDTPFNDQIERHVESDGHVTIVEECRCDYSTDLVTLYIPHNESKIMEKTKIMPSSYTHTQAVHLAQRLNRAIIRWHKKRWEKPATTT